MWNYFSFSQLIPNVSLGQFIPAVPKSFYSSAGSTFIAAAVGGTYGFLGRIIYPNAGISPLHYAVWFALAFRVKQVIFSLEKNLEQFLGEETDLERFKDVPKDQLEGCDFIRLHCWEVMGLTNQTLKQIDHVFSRLFNIRPAEEITADNVADASFFEMCRYRIWPIFKMTILDTLSFALAHRLSNSINFTIPDQTAVQLLLVIRSIVQDIILIPALYMYARICNQIADHLIDDDDGMAAYWVEWIHWCLPAL